MYTFLIIISCSIRRLSIKLFSLDFSIIEINASESFQHGSIHKNVQKLRWEWRKKSKETALHVLHVLHDLSNRMKLIEFLISRANFKNVIKFFSTGFYHLGVTEIEHSTSSTHASLKIRLFYLGSRVGR